MSYSSGIAAAAVLSAFGGSLSGEGGNSGGGQPAAVSLQPGQWEMTNTIVRMSVPGMPADLQMPPPNTTRTCITPEQAASPTFDLTNHEYRDCTVETNSIAGGRIHFSVQCQIPQGTIRATIDGRHDATTIALDHRISTRWQDATAEVDSRLTGRRIGECPAGEPRNAR
jgi:hypothetical protein